MPHFRSPIRINKRSYYIAGDVSFPIQPQIHILKETLQLHIFTGTQCTNHAPSCCTTNHGTKKLLDNHAWDWTVRITSGTWLTSNPTLHHGSTLHTRFWPMGLKVKVWLNGIHFQCWYFNISSTWWSMFIVFHDAVCSYSCLKLSEHFAHTLTLFLHQPYSHFTDASTISGKGREEGWEYKRKRQRI